MPEPRDESELRELIATELEHRLDRDHPLWRCVVVEQLAGDRWALIVMAHHSMVDGVSGMALFEQLCDSAQRVARPEAATGPGSGLGGWIAKGARLPVTAPRLALSILRTLVPVVYAAVAPGTPSSLNGPIGRQRRYALASVAMADVRQIGSTFGASINDVAIAAVTAAYRAVLLRRGEEPTADTVRILVPVSTRDTETDLAMHNRVSAILPHLPVHLIDPVERLNTVHHSVSHHRARGEAEAEASLLEIVGALPFAVGAWAFRLAGQFPQRSVAALATNVPGPREPLSMGGREVLEIWPCIPIAMRVRTTIAIVSYRDHLVFGITGDYDRTPDIDLIVAGIEDGVAELLASAMPNDSQDQDQGP